MSAENRQFTSEELSRIDEADDLKISPFREDGVTYGTPTWIWAVRLDDDLYVRAYNGQDSRWYKSAIKQKAGRIHAAELVKDVTFELVKGDINAEISEAYKKKYAGSPYLPPMIGNRAKSATVKIIPDDLGKIGMSRD